MRPRPATIATRSSARRPGKDAPPLSRKLSEPQNHAALTSIGIQSKIVPCASSTVHGAHGDYRANDERDPDPRWARGRPGKPYRCSPRIRPTTNPRAPTIPETSRPRRFTSPRDQGTADTPSRRSMMTIARMPDGLAHTALHALACRYGMKLARRRAAASNPTRCTSRPVAEQTPKCAAQSHRRRGSARSFDTSHCRR